MNRAWQRLVAALACTLTAGAHAATYQLDEFSLTNNGTTTFIDTFDDGTAPAPGPEYYAIGAPFPSGAEDAGKLGLNAAQGMVYGTGRVQFAAPSSAVSGSVFSAAGRFDFVTPQAGETYFVRLDDLYWVGGAGVLVKSYSVAVDRVGGQTFASLAALDLFTGAITRLSYVPLNSGSSQITLAFTGTSNGQVTASYQLSGESQIDIGTFSPMSGHLMFRTAFGAFASPVPEPDSVVMMLAGLGMLTWFARRRPH